MTKQELIDFEKKVAEHYENGLIKSPIHLSGGNESELIEIFKDIKRTDLVCSTWRSHLHALLHGIHPDELMRQILAGKSMSINSINPWFYTSSIAGGILSIAIGLGMAIKRKAMSLRAIAEPVGPLHAAWDEISELENKRVWCFVGDATSLMGLFHESTRYAWNFQLPVTFVVEDNGLSVKTPVRETYGISKERTGLPPEDFLPNVKWYNYKLTQEHHGIGKWIPF